MPTTDPRYPGKIFVDYEFVEYPKQIGYDNYNRPIVVHDAIEEDRRKGDVVGKVATPAEAPKPVVSAEDGPKPKFKP